MISYCEYVIFLVLNVRGILVGYEFGCFDEWSYCEFVIFLVYLKVKRDYLAWGCIRVVL